MPRALCGRTALWSLRHEVEVSSASLSDSKTCVLAHRNQSARRRLGIARRAFWLALPLSCAILRGRLIGRPYDEVPL
jgi:hypothetical protein